MANFDPVRLLNVTEIDNEMDGWVMPRSRGKVLNLPDTDLKKALA